MSKSQKVQTRKEKREAEERKRLETHFQDMRESIEKEFPHALARPLDNKNDIWVRKSTGGLWTRPPESMPDWTRADSNDL